MLRILIPVLAFAAGLACMSLAQTVLNPTHTAIACAYSVSPSAPVSGQFYAVQCDSSGQMKVVGP